MSEMIERVARALEPAAFATYDLGYTQRNAFDTTAFLNAEKTVRRARRKAHVAIEAMREPTEAMQRAGFLANVWTNPTGIAVGRVTMPADKPWAVMIDAALEPSPPQVSPPIRDEGQ